MLLRNIQVGQVGNESTSRDSAAQLTDPTKIPANVDDALLAAVLRAGRPEGEQGLVTVRGIGCPTIAQGRGRPVLCVHGLGHDAWDWTPFFVRCTNRAAVTAIDLPGFGLADKPADDAVAYDMSLFVEAILAAAAQAPEPPVVVGSSLGGHIALMAALQEPEAFAKLVLAAPGGVVDVPRPMQAIAHAYYSVDAICHRSEDEIVSNSRKIFAKSTPPIGAFSDVLAARKLAVHRSARKREFAVPFAGIVRDVFNHVVIDRVASIRIPTLVVSGSRDVVVPPDACASAARRMNARFVSFDGVGHCPHIEAADQFADVVMSFIEGT